MAWIPMYLNKLDEEELLNFLNKDEEIAFLISNGEKKWKAVKNVSEFTKSRIALWHIPSGKLPLLTLNDKEEWIEEPFLGWTEKRKGRNENLPYFGAGWPGIIHLNIRTGNNKKIGMSSFEWIGNHYSIVEVSANETTKKYWNRLRRQIKKNSVQISRSDKDGSKPEVYAFNGALDEIEKGKERSLNPM